MTRGTFKACRPFFSKNVTNTHMHIFFIISEKLSVFLRFSDLRFVFVFINYNTVLLLSAIFLIKKHIMKSFLFFVGMLETGSNIFTRFKDER